MQDVILNNLQLLRETHLMDRDYFRLIMTLVRGSSEICNHKIRRTGWFLREWITNRGAQGCFGWKVIKVWWAHLSELLQNSVVTSADMLASIRS